MRSETGEKGNPARPDGTDGENTVRKKCENIHTQTREEWLLRRVTHLLSGCKLVCVSVAEDFSTALLDPPVVLSVEL